MWASERTAMVQEAEGSEQNESFRSLRKGANYRLGWGARVRGNDVPQFFLEVLVYLFPQGRVELDLLHRELAFFQRMVKEGYTLGYQDDGCISCERTMKENDIEKEMAKITGLTSSLLE